MDKIAVAGFILNSRKCRDRMQEQILFSEQRCVEGADFILSSKKRKDKIAAAGFMLSDNKCKRKDCRSNFKVGY